MMTFYTWMTKNFRHADSPFGKLADQMHRHSTTFIRGRGYSRNRAYVTFCCEGHMATFEDAWQMYEAYKADKRNA